jgi:hypothetical protein
VLHGGGWVPFIAGRGGGRRVERRRNRGRRNGDEKPWAWQVGSGRGLEWSARSERGRSVVQTGRLKGWPSGFDIFLELSKPTQTWKIKMDTLRASKIPKFCTLLDCGIMNNFFNCANIQISTDVELKFLEHIHNLNILLIFKGV